MLQPSSQNPSPLSNIKLFSLSLFLVSYYFIVRVPLQKSTVFQFYRMENPNELSHHCVLIFFFLHLSNFIVFSFFVRSHVILNTDVKLLLSLVRSYIFYHACEKEVCGRVRRTKERIMHSWGAWEGVARGYEWILIKNASPHSGPKRWLWRRICQLPFPRP